MRLDQSFLDEICDRVPISEIVGARVTFDRKKSVPARGDYWFCCPCHGEKSPSAHCEDRKGRWHCFGCGMGGNHFKFLMEVDGVSFMRAVEIVADHAGIRMPNGRDSREETQAEKEARIKREKERARVQKAREEAAEREKAARTKTAGAIWKETKPFKGSLAEVYFNWRGLNDPRDANLRFHPGLEHPEGGIWPALIARVQNAAGKGVGIWRIFLMPDGCGKAPVASPKLGLGPTAGGAVRLGGLNIKIGICEGIETARAVRLLGTPYPVWPCLSTSGIMGFEVPEGVGQVIVFPDPDGSKWKRAIDPKTKLPLDQIKNPPGIVAAEEFIARNSGKVKCSIAEAAFDDDYLTVYQRSKGLPVR